MIEPGHEELTIKRQCELIGLARSMWYYEPKPMDPEDLKIMRLLDEKYLERPYFGIRRMTDWITKSLKKAINHKRVARLLRLTGLETIYPKPNLSKPAPGHKIYPYLLRGLAITRPNQVWCTDITYIRLTQGFIYLVAIMDWFSRYVLSWNVSVTLDSAFCLEALDEALRRFPRPDIFNSDQGSQFTSQDFTGRLSAEGIHISMDGRGRALDNIFIERLWRSVKYEEVYLHDYATVPVAVRGLRNYFEFYNIQRPHQSLDDRTPREVYMERMRIGGQPWSCAA